MFTIGAHVSIAKGFKKAAQISVDIGANTFQFSVEIQEVEMQKNLMKRIWMRFRRLERKIILENY